MWTTLPVEAETATSLPSGEIAMWSERCPSTSKRHTILPVRMLMPTTSLNDGRDTIRSRPSFDEYMSSTYWLLPSPISRLIPTKKGRRVGS
jgi:hypothetical protein